MTPEIRLSPEPHEAIRLKNSEEERICSAGIALLIVGIDLQRNGDNRSDPLFWTIKELEDKPDTKKRAGEISIPAETRKTGETRTNNVLGALAEFCDDTNLEYIKKHLFLANGVFREKVININGNLVDVSVLIYDGDLNLPITPLNASEVAPNKWLSRSQIQSSENVRPVLIQAVKQDINEGLSKNILDIYVNNVNELKPVFDVNFGTLSEFYQNRELFSDIPLCAREKLSTKFVFPA